MSSKTTRLMAITAGLGLALSAAGAQAFEGQAGLHFADFGDADNGFGVSAQADVIPEVRVHGEYTSTDGLDLLRLGGGWLMDLNPVEIELGGNYQFWDFEGDFEDDVYGLHGIVGYPVMEELTLHGKLEFLTYDNFDDDTLVIGFGADYRFTDQIGMDFSAEHYTEDFVDDTFIRLGGYYAF